MFRPRLTVALCAVVAIACVAIGGIRGPGPYHGIVAFDRWDGCTLHHGLFVNYVSDEIKEQFRAHAGRPVTLDATDVWQPRNPGHAVIRKATLRAEPARAAAAAAAASGVSLSARAQVTGADGPAEIVVTVANATTRPATVKYDLLGPTVMTRNRPDDVMARMTGSNGRSFATIAERAVWSDNGGADGAPRPPRRGGTSFRWWVSESTALARERPIAPGERQELTIAFDLTAGEYEVLLTYADVANEGEPVVSNSVAFDVEADGTVRFVPAPERR